MNKYIKYSAITLCAMAQMQASIGGSKLPLLNRLRSDNGMPSVVAASEVPAAPADQNKKKPNRSEPKMAHNIAAGSVAGLVEVYAFGHVMSYLVNQAIQKNKFSLQPANWTKQGFISLHTKDMLRGIHVTAGGMI